MASRGWPVRSGWTAIRCAGPSDRAEAWIRVGLLAVFLIAGPMAALGAGHWAYHAGTTAARMPTAPAHRVKPAALQQAPTITDLPRVGLEGPDRGPGEGHRPFGWHR